MKRDKKKGKKPVLHTEPSKVEATQVSTPGGKRKILPRITAPKLSLTVPRN